MSFIEVEEPVEQSNHQTSHKPTKERSNRSQGFLRQNAKAITVIAVLVLIAGVFLNLNNQKRLLEQELAGKTTPTAQTPTETNREAEELAAEIGQYLDLPKDETPTVATVSDVEKVRDQSFFANAENNDKVLLFNKSGRAVLYRPSTKKVIEFARTNTPAQN